MIARYMLAGVTPKNANAPGVGPRTQALKPFELMNLANGSGESNLSLVLTERLRSYIIDNKIIREQRVVRI
jgi:hypothetical protein